MQIIAHRGASGLAPENTLKAMSLALDLGAKAIELDVQWADGELWVFHDRRLERCTNGQGVLTGQSREYLASLDAGDGERIPTLWQVMALVAGRCELHIELKGAHTAEPVADRRPHGQPAPRRRRLCRDAGGLVTELRRGFRRRDPGGGCPSPGAQDPGLHGRRSE